MKGNGSSGDEIDPVELAEAVGVDAVKMWCRRAAEQDQEAIQVIYYHCAPPVERLVRRKMGRGSEQDAEDIAQSALIALFDQLGSFRGQNKEGKRTRLRSYACGIAGMMIRRHYSRPKNRPMRAAIDVNIEDLVIEEDFWKSQEELGVILLESMRLEQIHRLLGVNGWQDGDGANPELTPEQMQVFRQCYSQWLPEKDVLAPLWTTLSNDEKKIINEIRGRTNEVLEDYEPWKDYDPADSFHREREIRIMGRLVVRMMPKGRVRNPEKFRLAEQEQTAFHLLFEQGMKPVDVATSMNIRRSNVDTLKNQIRVKARKAKDYLLDVWTVQL